MDGNALPCDAVIFGGGAAGLWCLDMLAARGLRVLLLESDRLGGGQTACAQGIIHGGLKYTLDGVVSGSAAAIRDMPDHWRACLAGARAPDLAGTRVRADHCHLWRTGGVRSRLGMIGARVGLRTRPRAVADDERPPALATCPGTVARLAEPVIDPVSLAAGLAGRHPGSIMRVERDGVTMDRDATGRVVAVTLTRPGGGAPCRIDPGRVVLTAGAGNDGLVAAAGLGDRIRQQRRPLHMLMLRGPLPELNGHCVDGARTRVTITSDTDAAGRRVWQVGGQIAEDGVDMEPAALIRHGRRELDAVLPDVDLGGVEWATYRVDRAEAAAGGRPDDIFVEAVWNVVVGWPTKLALVPRLAERVGEHVPRTTTGPAVVEVPQSWPRPEVARPPWETHEQWSSDV